MGVNCLITKLEYASYRLHLFVMHFMDTQIEALHQLSLFLNQLGNVLLQLEINIKTLLIQLYQKLNGLSKVSATYQGSVSDNLKSAFAHSERFIESELDMLICTKLFLLTLFIGDILSKVPGNIKLNKKKILTKNLIYGEKIYVE